MTEQFEAAWLAAKEPVMTERNRTFAVVHMLHLVPLSEGYVASSRVQAGRAMRKATAQEAYDYLKDYFAACREQRCVPARGWE